MVSPAIIVVDEKFSKWRWCGWPGQTTTALEVSVDLERKRVLAEVVAATIVYEETAMRGGTLKIAQTNESPLLAPRPALPPAIAPSTARSGAVVISRDDVTASLRDMGTMLSQAQIRPYYSEGVPDGFMISGIKPGSIYEKVGLIEGDIVQGADDRRLTTADDLTALYNSMKSGSSLTLKIKRRGQQESLHFVFR